MVWIKRILKVVAVISLSCLLILALLFRSDISAEEIEEKYSTPQSHFIDVDGTNVHVRILGEGDPIFLLHGSFSSLHTWDAWQQELSPYFLTISLDFPSHGLTGPDEKKRYSLTDYTQLILRLSEILNLDQFHLAGNSMGGAVALQLASNNPEKVLSLNLIDAAGASREQKFADGEDMKPNEAWIFKLAKNPVFSLLLLKCTPKFLFAKNMREVYADPTKVTDKAITRYYELMLRKGNRQATLDRLGATSESRVDFDRLTMPTLILWGKADSWIPVAQGYLLEKAISKSKLIVFDNAGHVPMEEIPTESVAKYLSFLGVEVRNEYFHAPKLISYAD
ncbi:pimeloyl-ACP methyl ester carboxylesterase [Algoriphagus ratkowskyi]|uniref:Alpha/beta hydrolase n=1 Tax=Algoriphagus ratkowskyi TaxID=57028 RepID=A0A2W7S1R5_9BACT|nr:alpha/beta hydrolase [Algoriphagus ratkowskyi]PZX57085.1 pimeloyl-ACP methyl ester carboxylesterase [Algoriphagus ratkowskyi]TXD79979.1 alpha/beta hydrolase [Algoriphagus ratkowskyi]